MRTSGLRPGHGKLFLDSIATTMPKIIGRYHILELVGAGSMGIVYKAFDPVLGRVVAIKTIRYDLLSPGLDYNRFINRFYHEARISGTLSHPNIVSLFDMGETEHRIPFLAMEYVAGKTLREILMADERLRSERLMPLLSQMAEGIDYAHGKGVVHRDIKPSNIIVEDRGSVKITDFGIAKLVDSQFTLTKGSQLGTPGYMSPEQILGDDLDARSDIFSLGVVTFEMLSGERPFPGPHVAAILYRIVHGDPIRPRNLESSGLDPVNWHEVFSKALAKDPSERYATAGEFVRELATVCSNPTARESKRKRSRATASYPAPFGQRARGERSDETVTLASRLSIPQFRGRLALGAAAGLALTMVVISLVFLGAPPPEAAEPIPSTGLARASLSGPRSLWLPHRNGAEAATGSISIRSDPEGAAVLLNGRFRGETPLALTELPLGAHSILVDKEAYQAVNLAVLLSADGPHTTLDIPLKALHSPEAVAPNTSGPVRLQKSTPPELASEQIAPYRRLAAMLRLEGQQLLLQNQDQFDWTRVQLNLAEFGIVLSVDRIQAGQTYTIVHPATFAPQHITIWCNTPAGKGFYSAIVNP